MQAIIRSGNKQYRVKKGDVIHVELLQQNPGDAVEFHDVLYLTDGTGISRIGTPNVKGCIVKGQYLAQVKGPKITAIKYKQRKNQVRKFGHRQKYAQVRILDIVS